MDIPGLLKLLNAHKVRYVVIGAHAFAVHGWSRTTQDIDIFMEPTLANARRTLHALREFGYDISDLSIRDLLAKKTLFREYITLTDIHPFAKGVSFRDVWKHRVLEKFRGIPTYFASLDHVIKMKKAAGRPKDQEDLKYLERLKARAAKPKF